jgi:hypothetical protein
MQHDPQPGRAELTVADLMARTGLPRWTVTRMVRRWARRGWPRVRRAPCQGDPRGAWRVDLLEYEAVRRGAITEAPLAA